MSHRSQKKCIFFQFYDEITERRYQGAFDRQHLGTMNNRESGRFAQHGYGKRVDRAMLFIFWLKHCTATAAAASQATCATHSKCSCIICVCHVSSDVLSDVVDAPNAVYRDGVCAFECLLLFVLVHLNTHISPWVFVLSCNCLIFLLNLSSHAEFFKRVSFQSLRSLFFWIRILLIILFQACALFQAKNFDLPILTTHLRTWKYWKCILASERKSEHNVLNVTKDWKCLKGSNPPCHPQECTSLSSVRIPSTHRANSVQ